MIVSIIFLFIRIAFIFFVPICTWLLLFICSVPHIDNVSIFLRKPSIKIYNSNNQVIGTYGDLYGKAVQSHKLPKYLIDAILVTEDRTFYSHYGFDLRGILRAFIMNLSNQRILQGGSTLTQQLSKNFLQNAGLAKHNEKSISRKIKELIVSILIEKRFSKNDILSMYLNRVYFGAGVYGIDGASQFYFGKSATELSLYESVILVGLLRAPSSYAPHIYYDKALDRAKMILSRLVKERLITEEEMEATLLLSTPPIKKNSRSIIRYYTDWIMKNAYLSLPTNCDMNIYSTIDEKIQQYAEQAVQEVHDKYGKLWNIEQNAFVVLDNHGAVKAMIGNTDYKSSEFNIATDGKRQMASTFKYFVYLLAMEDGYNINYLIEDGEIDLNGWKPRNFFDYNLGEVSLKFAFAKSINTSAVRLLKSVGIIKLYKLLQKMQILSPEIKRRDLNYTIALGTFETSVLKMASSLTPMLENGIFYFPFGIDHVISNNRCIYKHKHHPDRICSPNTIERMKEMMTAVIEIGTGRSMKSILDIPLTVYGKTGMSQNYRDLSYLCVLEKDQLSNIAPNGLVMCAWSGSKVCSKYQPGKHMAIHICKRFLELLNDDEARTINQK